MSRAVKVVAVIIIAGILLYVGSVFITRYMAQKAGVVALAGSGDERINFDGITLHIPKGWLGVYYSPAKIGYDGSLLLEKEPGISMQGDLISTKTLKNSKKMVDMKVQQNAKDITSRYADIKEIVAVTQAERNSGEVYTKILYTSKSGGIDIAVYSPKKGPLPNIEIADEAFSMFK